MAIKIASDVASSLCLMTYAGTEYAFHVLGLTVKSGLLAYTGLACQLIQKTIHSYLLFLNETSTMLVALDI